VRLPDAVWSGWRRSLALVPWRLPLRATLTAGLFRACAGPTPRASRSCSGSRSSPPAGLKGLLDSLQTGFAPGELPIFLLGIAVSGLSGFAAIAGLLRYLQRASTMVFVAYRLGLGVLLLLLVAIGFR
jgi:undecaprenyl-diphosphatase